MIKGLDNYVYLREEDHTYWNRDGQKYESISAFRNRFKKGFDRKSAYFVAGKGDYTNMSPEDVLKKWDNHRDNRAGIGTLFHNAFELYEKTTQILPENEHLRPCIKSVCAEYSSYYRIYQEQVLYDNEFMVAGTADKLLVCSSHKDSPIDISDYKTNEKGIQAKDFDKNGKPKHDYFLEPISHLLESKYSDYALQLSLYAYMLERKTGRRIGSLRIHYIDTNRPLHHYFIPVPYLKLEAQAMLQWKKDHPDAIFTGNWIDQAIDTESNYPSDSPLGSRSSILK